MSFLINRAAIAVERYLENVQVTESRSKLHEWMVNSAACPSPWKIFYQVSGGEDSRLK